MKLKEKIKKAVERKSKYAQKKKQKSWKVIVDTVVLFKGSYKECFAYAVKNVVDFETMFAIQRG